MEANNVVAFPNRGNPPPPVAPSEMTVDEIKRVGISNKEAYASSIAEEITADVYMKIAMAGIDVSTDTLLKDSMFVYESVRSLMLKAMGIEHPIQKVAARLMKVPEELRDVLKEDLKP